MIDDASLPPPPVLDHPTFAEFDVRQRRVGELTTAWRTMTVITWIAVVLAFAAIWNSSWKLGLSTWWLGPEASPRFPIIMISPFIAPVVVIALGFRQMRWLPYFGIGAAVCTALVAWGDVNRVDGFAAIEFALASGALLMSLASFTGVLRLRDGADTSSDTGTGTGTVTGSIGG